MTIRTINYTNRQRIRREDARILLRNEKTGIVFDARLNIENYGLPGDARIFVEAYRKTQYTRFDFGQVGALQPPSDRVLRDFDSTEAVLFRVKVVTNDVPHGLLLAEADQLRPSNRIDEDQNMIPLLPVVPEELGDEIWKLEFEGQQTLLKVNSEIGDWRTLARGPSFLALVYPSIFRTILWRIIYVEKHTDVSDGNDWRSRWLYFALSLPGVDDLPSDRDDVSLENWIDNVTSVFCRRHGTRKIFENYWTGVDNQ